MEPYTRNGGIIGKVMDFGATDRYVIGETTELDTIEYVGASTAAYVGTTGNYVTSLTSLTGGTDSAPQTGDLVIVFFALNPADTGVRSYRITGYTQIANIYANDTEDAQLQVGYKFMGATPDTSVTITGGSGDIDHAAVVGIQVWRGVDTTNVLDVDMQNFSQTNTHRPTPPDITPVTAGSYIIVAGAGGHNGGTDTFSSSNLTTFRSAGGNDTHDVILGFGYHQWVSGTFNPATFTSTQGDSSLYAAVSVSIALRPATITVPLFGNKKNSGIWDLQAVVEYESILQPGQQEYTTPGTYSWTAPQRVTSVCVVCVGGGGGAGVNDGEGDPVIGGAGGGLGWKNDIPVIPGNSYTVVVGAGGVESAEVEGRGGPGGNSYFIDTSTVAGFGGAGGGRPNATPIDAIGGTYVGDGGGNGGNGGTGVSGSSAGGGGGAGGYSGSGGIAGDGPGGNGAAGSGGGGGGGGGGGEGDCAGSGGGVGIYGEGANGDGGLHTGADGTPGKGGSGGADGTQGGGDIRGNGGAFGGGGAGADRVTESGNGAGGAVRIIWGAGRAFPSTNTADL